MNPVPFAGSVPSLPKFTPNVVSRIVKNDFGPYHDLSAAYSGSQGDVEKALAKAGDTFANVRAPSPTSVLPSGYRPPLRLPIACGTVLSKCRVHCEAV